jgi:hypothetical protein
VEIRWNRGPNFTSDVLKFFEEERDGQVNFYSTHKPNKNNKFIFHMSFLWYNPGTGEAHNVKLGKVFVSREDWMKMMNSEDVPSYKQDVEEVLKKAEQNHAQLYEVVLDVIFQGM